MVRLNYRHLLLVVFVKRVASFPVRKLILPLRVKALLLTRSVSVVGAIDLASSVNITDWNFMCQFPMLPQLKGRF